MAEQWAEVLDEHRARQRRQIMTVALELVSERGLAGVSMSALAQRAGISRATLYHYFPDLEQVLLAWVGEEVDAFVAELARELSGLDDPVAAFEPFVTTKPEGMGLGLAICRSIVAAHGGSLSAERNTGFGTTFTVTLPLRPAGSL